MPFNEYQPFEAGRILYWARSAQLLSLDQYLPGVFDMAAIADRVQRVFRFEVDFESVLEADYPPSAGQGPPSCTSGQCPVHVTQHARAGKAVLQLDDGLLCWIMASSPLEQLDWSVSAWGSSFRVDTSRPPLRGRVYSVYYEYLKILTDPEPDSQEPNQDPCAVLAPPPLARPTGITLLGAVGDAGDGQVLGDNGWGYVDAFNFGFLWRGSQSRHHRAAGDLQWGRRAGQPVLSPGLVHQRRPPVRSDGFRQIRHRTSGSLHFRDNDH